MNERLLFVNSSTNQIGILFSGCFGSIGLDIDKQPQFYYYVYACT